MFHASVGDEHGRLVLRAEKRAKNTQAERGGGGAGWHENQQADNLSDSRSGKVGNIGRAGAA